MISKLKAAAILAIRDALADAEVGRIVAESEAKMQQG